MGSRNFLFAAIVTIVKPIKPPIIEGNSGPINIPASKYGIVKLNAAKIQNLNMESPSVQDLFVPKNLVIIITSNNGISVPQIACIIATSATIILKKDSQEEPISTKFFVIPVLSRPPWTPTINGVPTAPKETGVD